MFFKLKKNDLKKFVFGDFWQHIFVPINLIVCFFGYLFGVGFIKEEDVKSSFFRISQSSISLVTSPLFMFQLPIYRLFDPVFFVISVCRGGVWSGPDYLSLFNDIESAFLQVFPSSWRMAAIKS